jgi:molybdopterin-guanine dinucleotide biosynthesis protein A
MDAILLAGGKPNPEDPLYAESQGQSKALIDVAGKPMIQWQLDALSKAKLISNVVIIGINSVSNLSCEKPMTIIPDAGGWLENILAGMDHVRKTSPATTHALISSTDIPTVTHEILDWRIQAALESSADLNFAVVERSTMEARFPGSKRSFVRLQDVEVCGGDANVANVNLVADNQLWNRLFAARKSVRRQASFMGFDLLIRLLTRQLSLHQAEQKLSSRLGLKGRVVISPYAELAMDVDKPGQLEIVRRDLKSRIGVS